MLAAGKAAGAENLACDLALLLQQAWALGSHVDGIPLDWSKCYDHMPLVLVADFLEACGLGEEFIRPLTDMYEAPRRVVADGLCGEPRRPLLRRPPPAAAGPKLLWKWGCRGHRRQRPVAEPCRNRLLHQGENL